MQATLVFIITNFTIYVASIKHCNCEKTTSVFIIIKFSLVNAVKQTQTVGSIFNFV